MAIAADIIATEQKSQMWIANDIVHTIATVMKSTQKQTYNSNECKGIKLIFTPDSLSNVFY